MALAAPAKPSRRQTRAPSIYDDNFFSLPPGESLIVQIKFADRAAVDTAKVRLAVDDWNLKQKTTQTRKNVPKSN